MAYKQSKHIFQGMNKDLSEDKQKGIYYIDARNIRITAREDTTLLSVTNEKGNIKTIDKSFGQYIGHAVLNKYLVLFTIANGNSCITRIEITAGNYIVKVLYSGNLGFSADYPIETLVDYETEEVQKVYWTDGLNQPRVINIVGNIKENNDNQFDFVPEVYSGGNNIDVKIEKLFSTEGVFKAGTIQYFITYYNKFGQESNVIWQSPLLYISSKDRGNSPAETVTNSFKLTINISNISFDSIRIYSVQHTSENTDLIGKRIIDLNVSNESIISYVDNGTSGESIDPAELYYKGGIPTAIGTMSAKDQVLFLGNITLKDRSNVSQSIKDTFRGENIEYELSASFKAEDAENKLYDYYNQLNEVGQTEIVNIDGVNTSLTHSIKSFKYLETYRFGIQFQDKWGKWSEPVFIKDVQNIYPPTIKNVTIQSTPITQRSDNYVFLATAKLNIASFKQSLIDAGYIKARPLVVLPKENERECIAQGVLCPTVYNVGDRKTNSPYAQPSWFFRPYGNTGAISNIRKELATFLPSVHNSVIQGKTSIYSEIEKAPETQIPPAVGNDASLSDDAFFIDQSIATLNSPDIEFTELNSDLSDCGFRIIGAIDVTGFAGSDYIQTSTPPNNFYTPKGTAFPTEGRPTMGEVAEGFIPKYVQQTNLYLNSDTKGWGIMGSGGFWYDTPYTTWIDHAEGHANYVLPSKYRYAFMVYPWQATGSLNNTSNKDVINSRGITDRINTDTAKLEYKTIANLRYSTNTIYKIDSSLYGQNLYPYYGEDEDNEQLNYQTSDIQVLDPKVSDTINVRSSNGSFVYYSNIDKLLSVPLDNSEEVARYAINSRGYNKNYDWDIFYTDFDTPDHPYDELKSDRGDVRALRRKEIKEINGRQESSYLINDGESSELHSVVRAVNTLLSTKVTSTSITYRSNKHAVISLSDDGNNQTILPSITIYKEGSEQERQNKTIGNIPIKNPITENYDYNVKSYNQSTKKYTLHKDYFWTQHYSGIKQYSFSIDVPKTFYNRGYLLIGEIYRKTVENRFGGDTDDALQQNVWIPAGESIDLTDENTKVIRWTEGDTYFQRYDCLKTYPYSNESLNNIVEILSFNCESRVNIAGRYDRNRGLENNTYINNDNFNLLNKVYNQKDNFFSYNILDDRFDINTFKTQLTWSKVKTAGDLIDNWTNITLANTLDLDGDKGELVSLNRFKNDIIAFQPKGISQIKFNSNIQIQTTQGMPVELANSGKVDGKQYLYEGVGCQNKWSICDEPHDSLYFIDNYAKSIYKLSNQGLVSITDIKGFRAWMENNNSVNSWKPYRNNSIESTATNRNASNTIDTKNPAPFRTFYDKTFRDIYFVNRDTCLIYSDLLDEFISFADYQSTNAMFNIEDGFYAFYKNECLYKQFAGDYSNIYGELKDYWITFIDNQIPEVNKIYTNIEYRNDVYNNDELQSSETFSTVRVFNEYQDTTDVPIKTVLDRPILSNLQKKFRVWRIQIPRDGNNIVGDRINNTWAKITLKKHPKDSNQKTVLHDAVVGYYY